MMFVAVTVVDAAAVASENSDTAVVVQLKNARLAFVVSVKVARLDRAQCLVDKFRDHGRRFARGIWRKECSVISMDRAGNRQWVIKISTLMNPFLTMRWNEHRESQGDRLIVRGGNGCRVGAGARLTRCI